MHPIKEIKISDPAYPAILKKITDPPKIIYYRGIFPTDQPAIAVVGTRHFTPYGKQAALEISEDLSLAGFTIISGLAIGVDSCAHLGALNKNNMTIAILGSGIDENSIYPRANCGLAKKILENGGSIISEYPPGTRCAPYTFPRRNRIIAGLAQATVVVEARLKSGSLITAEFAKKSGRPVYALPGNIYSKTSQGCNFLIRNGAKIIENAETIINDFHKILPRSRKTIQNGENEVENKIIQALGAGPTDINNLILNAHLPTNIICAALANLEIQGKVRNLGGNFYCIIK